MTENALMHHGVKGQKWGVRRYQNEDGTLTAAGKKHAGGSDNGETAKPKKASGSSSKKGMSAKTKKRLKIGAGIVGGLMVAGLAAYAVENRDIISMKFDVARGERMVKKMTKRTSKFNEYLESQGY